MDVAISSPCVVFLLYGKFRVGTKDFTARYEGYEVTDETTIKLAAYSVVVVIEHLAVEPSAVKP